MRHSLPMSVLALVLPLHACVMTNDALIAASDAVDDQRIVGKWEEVDGKDRATVIRDSAGAFTITHESDGRVQQYDARIGRLGSRMILDVQPSQTAENDREGMIHGHLMFSVVIGDGEVQVAGVNVDSVKAALRDGRIALEYVYDDKDLVLQGNTAKLRAALGAWISTPAAFGEAGAFRRVAAFRAEGGKTPR